MSLLQNAYRATVCLGFGLLLATASSAYADTGYPDACSDGHAPTLAPGIAELPGGGPIATGWDDEEILVREALRRGLGRRDLSVQRRRAALLSQSPQYRTLPEMEHHRRAAELEIGNDDPFIRRRLVRKLRFLLEAEGGPIRPTEEMLLAYFASHRDAYQQPERVRISQIYLNADRHGSDLERRAVALLADLQQRPFDPQDVLARSDMSLFRLQLPRSDEAQLSRELGIVVARQIMACAPMAWCGPISSPYGMHLVWVHEKETARRSTFDEARRAVQLDFIATERQHRFETALAALQAQQSGAAAEHGP